MRRIREALRLHLQAGLSYTEVGRALKISKSGVGKFVSLARVLSPTLICISPPSFSRSAPPPSTQPR